MRSLLSSYNPIGKTLVALEYSIQQEELVVFGLELVQKKGELNIAQTFTLKELEKLQSVLKTTAGVHLVITDDQVLYKEVFNTGTDAEVVGEAFPNLNLNDFYYQILRSTEKSFIAVSRKEYVENCIQEFKGIKGKIVTISLGALATIALAAYAEGEILHSHTVAIGFKNEEIISINTKKEEVIEHYTIEGLAFSSTHTLSLATALDAVIKNNKISGNLDARNKKLQKAYKESRFFKNTLQIGVGFLLVALLINFFVFNANYKKWQGLQEELQVYTVQKEQITNKQAEVTTKEALVESILATGFSKSSWFINSIVQAQPSTIILTSFAYQPLKKPIRKDKSIILEKEMIAISGTSIDKSDFTIWLRTIEGLEFVDSVTITQYGINKKNTSDFELTINIKTSNETTD
ncbi:hypothetical protein [Aquimarina aquimarini]|uniref:hypothetical protein n=1 Tax=Aquimarina aquimarini TaxID=1191734 RepID=UPI000D54E4C8|nr:hypothetical protein [Aquimarina aquimarini]